MRGSLSQSMSWPQALEPPLLTLPHQAKHKVCRFCLNTIARKATSYGSRSQQPVATHRDPRPIKETHGGAPHSETRSELVAVPLP